MDKVSCQRQAPAVLPQNRVAYTGANGQVADSTRVDNRSNPNANISLQNSNFQAGQLGEVASLEQPREGSGTPREFPPFTKSANANKANYAKKFGDQSYVSDLQDDNLRELLSLVGDLNPDVAQRAQNGTLRKQDIISLQKSLTEAGFPVGKCGVDGKFGKDTFGAVASWIESKQKQQAPATPETMVA